MISEIPTSKENCLAFEKVQVCAHQGQAIKEGGKGYLSSLRGSDEHLHHKSGSSGLITVKVGTFGGFVNVSLRVSGTQFGRTKHNKKTDKSICKKIKFLFFRKS